MVYAPGYRFMISAQRKQVGKFMDYGMQTGVLIQDDYRINIVKKTVFYDWNKIKNSIREDLGEFLWERTKRNPMILPIISEV